MFCSQNHLWFSPQLPTSYLLIFRGVFIPSASLDFALLFKSTFPWKYYSRIRGLSSYCFFRIYVLFVFLLFDILIITMLLLVLVGSLWTIFIVSWLGICSLVICPRGTCFWVSQYELPYCLDPALPSGFRLCLPCLFEPTGHTSSCWRTWSQVPLGFFTRVQVLFQRTFFALLFSLVVRFLLSFLSKLLFSLLALPVYSLYQGVIKFCIFPIILWKFSFSYFPFTIFIFAFSVYFDLLLEEFVCFSLSISVNILPFCKYCLFSLIYFFIFILISLSCSVAGLHYLFVRIFSSVFLLLFLSFSSSQDSYVLAWSLGREVCA
jgi:hypothetical protein